jgi:dihydropteridine reductase
MTDQSGIHNFFQLYLVMSSVLAAHVASKYLSSGGLLVMTGSAPCCSATPGMLPYGMAKSAIHHLVKSLADPVAGGLKENVTTLAYIVICNIRILPETLDTPGNRSGMPTADFSAWTPLAEVVKVIEGWIRGERPASGSLVKVFTEAMKTKVEVV